VAPDARSLATIGWTAFFGWTIQAEALSGSATLVMWRDWIVDWSVPVLLIGVAWILAMRNSRREAIRFGETAAMLAHESSELEAKLSATNRELSLAREFLGSQSRELESLGRVASERISTHAGELQQLIVDNGKQVDAIGTTSETALANMTKLRDDLPVIATSARDTANQIGNAGRTADEQLSKLVNGFERLNQFGKASENQVSALSKRVEETLAGFAKQLDEMDTLSTERFSALNQKSESYRTELDQREVQALTAMQQRADELRGKLSDLNDTLSAQEEQSLTALTSRLAAMQEEGTTLSEAFKDVEASALKSLEQSRERLQSQIRDVYAELDSLDQKSIASSTERVEQFQQQAQGFEDKLDEHSRKYAAELSRRQDEFDTREAQASELLSQRLATLDEAIAERRERQVADTEKLVEHGQSISNELGTLNALFESVAAQAETTRDSLGTGIDAFNAQVASSREELDETNRSLEGLTDAGVRLLEIIQSSARQSREDLSQAIDGSANMLSAVEQRATFLTNMMEATGKRSGALANELANVQSNIEHADGAIVDLQSKLEANSEETLAKLNGMKAALGRLIEQTDTLSGSTQDTLREAIDKLQQSIESAYAAIEDGAQNKMSGIAERMGATAVEALERSMRNESAESAGMIEQAAAHASGVGREAAAQLRDQLAIVNELTGNLEQRVTRARELAEEQVNNDFARRMALITDSLNSSAIDIATALETDVPDTAWEAYLKGDRGIFTRKTVKLLDSGETRQIAEQYQNDDAFRDNVSRYIHDFEAMLRSVLSTRDGNALSVTLLGSDIGKLYVVLAQSIERFRN